MEKVNKMSIIEICRTCRWNRDGKKNSIKEICRTCRWNRDGKKILLKRFVGRVDGMKKTYKIAEDVWKKRVRKHSNLCHYFV